MASALQNKGLTAADNANKYLIEMDTETSDLIEALPYNFTKIANIIKESCEEQKKSAKEYAELVGKAATEYMSTMSKAQKIQIAQEQVLASTRKKFQEALTTGDEDRAKKLFVSIQKQEEAQQKRREVGQHQLELIKKKHYNIEEEREKLAQKRRMAELEEIANARGHLNEKEAEEYSKLYQAEEKRQREAQKKTWEDTKNFFKDGNFTDAVEGGLSKAAKKAIGNLGNFVTKAESVALNYAANVSSRLVGTDKSWQSISNLVTTNTATSNLVSMQKILDNINTAVTKGIAYNVEQRAFLATIKDEIISTFDAFDSNLLRLIRIQNADSTAARLGLEAALSQQFNAWFEDTAYLTDSFDTASANLLEASALLDRAAATELEYNAQKWLGALYEAGASTNLINAISQGIGWLGSGNIQSLTSNQQVNSLLAMSAQRAGMDYAKLLTEGLDSSNINKLMLSMINYLKEIAEDTKNSNVLRSAFGNVFSLSVSDVQAVTNLNTEMINNLMESNYQYQDLIDKTAERLFTIDMILPEAFKIATFWDNLQLGSGLNLMNDLGGIGYAGWKAFDIVEQMTGGIEIPVPFIEMGTIEGLGKAAIGALGMLGTLLTSEFSNVGVKDLGKWGGLEFRQLGGEGLSLSRSSGRSSHMQTGSSTDATDASVMGGIEESKSIQDKYTDSEETIDMEDLFYGFFDNKNQEGVLSNLHRLILLNGGAVPVKISSENGIPLAYSESAKTELRTLLTPMKKKLDDISEKIDDTTNTNSQTSVNVVGTDFKKGLVDFARIGSRSTVL